MGHRCTLTVDRKTIRRYEREGREGSSPPNSPGVATALKAVKVGFWKGKLPHPGHRLGGRKKPARPARSTAPGSRIRSGSGATPRVPEAVLPTVDDSVVVADRTMPINAVELIVGRMGHHDTGTTSMPRPT
jgi:hypothetical protein